nr:TMV resistance protein N-like [Malus domestica]XP_028945493.1 TMV resistance protein N-like [Malus domestica]XP_028945498.1 TMV resistance protein N-like [Malus domestica]XP_028945504.1 TMV resistance protein N-like [Malus domestica]XP_028945507.1 TMV resistance protein N-like [Malus domestica]XP_028945511.1 TMV resistance protein N-like [Malus domestica]
MHDLLEQMGKHIVWEESPTEPGERSRLWHPKDVYRVLTQNRGTKKIKGIVVILPVPDVIPLNTKSFSKMVNLEFFIIRNAYFSGCVEYLPDDLRWIEFGGLHFWGSNILQKQILTFNLQPNCHLRNLVTFIMPNSDIKQLKVFQNLAMLTSLNLSGSEFLEKIPNLSGSPNLKELILNECKRLVEVDDSVGVLDKLDRLSLHECSRLERFATRLRLRSLQSLNLYGCTRLKSFPEIEAEMESLEYLDISKSGIRELPSSIAYLTGLKVLKANECENLTVTSLHHIYGLQHLDYIEMDGCPKLVTFGKFSTRLDTSHYNGIPLALFNLRHLDLGGCNLSESDFLVPLQYEPSSLHCWSTVTYLDLSRNNFVSLPDCISNFVILEQLRLQGCKRLREIPHALPPNLRELYLDDCTSLEKIPKLPSGLRRLQLTNCFGLIGDEVAKLENNWLNWNQESLPRHRGQPRTKKARQG